MAVPRHTRVSFRRQALTLLMLARNCFVFFGAFRGLVVLLLMWSPTALMTHVVTPRLLACLAVAYAIGVKDKTVLEKMIEDLTNEGDYAAAGQARNTHAISAPPEGAQPDALLGP